MEADTGVVAAFQSIFGPDLYHEEPVDPENGVEEGQNREWQKDPDNVDKGDHAQQQEQEQHVDAYVEKIHKITSKFQKTRTSADELEQYLIAAKELAKEAEARALMEADNEFTPAWRNTGLPMKPSHLTLDNGKMSSARLINPKAIISQYQRIRSKEVWNPPRTYEYNDTSIQPNYLNSTKNLQARKLTLTPYILTRVHEASLKSRQWHMLSEDEVKQKIQESEERRREQDLKMPAAQFDLEKKIIHNMHHKLSFLRNPRYLLPPAVKLLQSQFVAGPRWNTPHKSRDTPPIKHNMTANPDTIFVVEPPEVVFTNYQVGCIYATHVKIRNVTNVIRNLRTLPPASQYFHMSLPRFPESHGAIAPGMHADLTIRFCPDSLADYEDEFMVDTAGTRFSVPLRAVRDPPALNLPEEIHVGEVLVGNRKVIQAKFRNSGGPGRFRVIPQVLWPGDYQEAPTEIAAVGPFEVWPLFFDMAPGDEVTINVSFEPAAMGVFDERLVMVCDNCQVKGFTVRGLASNLGIQAAGIDGCLLVPGMLDTPLSFGEVVPGSGFTKRVSVQNTTTLPFPFKWFQTSFPQMHPLPECHSLGQVHSRSQLDVQTPGRQISSMHNIPAAAQAAVQAATQAPAQAAAAAAAAAAAGAAVHNGLQASSLKGEVDIVALGMEQVPVFRIEPSEGTLQPGEMMEFAITFFPTALNKYVRWAQLKVDKTVAGQALKECNIMVLELGMEGLGAPAEVEVTPRSVIVSGSLMPNEVAKRTITLQNKTRAAAHFSIQGGADNDGCVTLSQLSGIIPPLAKHHVELTYKAGSEPGPYKQRLVCHVEHGQSTPIEVHATVGQPHVELVTTGINFGLVRLKASASKQIIIRNMSQTCSVPWSLQEIQHNFAPLPALALSKPSTSHSSKPGSPANRPASRQQPPPQPPAVASVATAAGLPREVVGSPRGSSACSTASRVVSSPWVHPAAAGSGASLHPAVAGSMHGKGSGVSSGCTYLAFEPASGVLGPGEERKVNANIFALSDGQHRTVIQLTSPGGIPECIEAFACIVTPKAVISKPKVDLGVTFVGVPVKYSLTLKNLSLLPLDFAFSVDSPEDDPLADMRIRPDKGMLDPGEEQELQIRYNPRATGKSIVIAVCNIEGAPQPTGFIMNSTIKGLDVTYDLLAADQYDKFMANLKDPKAKRKRDDVENFQGMSHLSPEVLTRLASHKQASTASRHIVANFGADVPLGEARHMYLVITNRTAIHTSVRTWLDQFGIDDVTRLTKQSRITVTKGDTGRTRIRMSKYTPIKLSDTAEKMRPFRSAAGNDMMATRRLQHESEQALGNKGLAVSITPPESTLEPWSRLVLQVSCFNDMCGDYFDLLHVKVGELPGKEIPVRVGVSGTPLVVQKERVLTKGLRGRTWRTVLEFGQLPAGVELQKSFYVFNTGGLDMHLSWVFMRFQDDSDCGRPNSQIFDVKLVLEHVDMNPADGHSSSNESMRLVLEPHAEPSDHPFTVDPLEKVIKGGESAKFTVKFRSGRPMPHRGYLVGTQKVFSPEAPICLKTWAAGETGDEVGTLMTGTFHPYAAKPPAPLQPLHVDLSAMVVTPRLEPDANSELSFVVHSTMVDQAQASGMFRHVVTLSNRQSCPLLFNLAMEGPFQLIGAAPSVPQDPIAYKGTTGMLPQLQPSLLYLPPQESVEATICFTPPKQDDRDDYSLDGSLVVNYSNEDVQVLPLLANVLHPALEVAPSVVDFGPVHVASPKPVSITLSNPTLVGGSWVLTTEGRKPKYLKQDEAAAAAMSEARFGPFTVKPAGGFLPGRGLKLPCTQRLTVTFAPTEAKEYRTKLVFAVSKGRMCTMELVGVGSFNETDEHLNKLFVI